MTVEEAQRRVDEIRAVLAAEGDAYAHSAEDTLRDDFLDYAMEADSLTDVRAVAAVVASTEDIDFFRWFE